MHRRLFEISKLDAEYQTINIPQDALSSEMLKMTALEGYNVSIPFKRIIPQYLDKISRKAKLYGSVNTVKNDYLIKGYTTEADGFLLALEREGIPLKGRVVILGTGSMARNIAFESVICGADTCLAATRYNLLDAAKLSGEIRDSFSNWDADTCLIDRMEGPIDLLINAVSMWQRLKHEEYNISDELLSNCACVFDTLYTPVDTVFLKKARANGAKVVSGLYMLLCQAVLSHKIWYEAEFPSEVIEQLYEDVIKMQKT